MNCQPIDRKLPIIHALYTPIFQNKKNDARVAQVIISVTLNTHLVLRVYKTSQFMYFCNKLVANSIYS